MQNSNLINGFSDYKSLSAFFQNLAKEMKDDGECNLSGNALLERFCKADGVSNRRTIKDMFNKIDHKKTLENVDSFSDLTELLKQNNNDFKLINTYFENKSEFDFDLLDEPNYFESHECFYINSSIGDIIFGEVKNAKYFSKHMDTNQKYFVSIDSSANVDEDPELILTYTTDSFYLAIKRLRMMVNKYRNADYLDNIDDLCFVQNIKANDTLLSVMEDRWETTGGEEFTDSEVIPTLKKIFKFKRELSDEMFQEIKTYLNSHLYFTISGYKTITDFESNRSDNGQDVAGVFTFRFEAIDFITQGLFDEYECLWIRSNDSEVTSIITKQNYKEMLKDSKTNPFTSS